MTKFPEVYSGHKAWHSITAVFGFFGTTACVKFQCARFKGIGIFDYYFIREDEHCCYIPRPSSVTIITISGYMGYNMVDLSGQVLLLFQLVLKCKGSPGLLPYSAPILRMLVTSKGKTNTKKTIRRP